MRVTIHHTPTSLCMTHCLAFDRSSNRKEAPVTRDRSPYVGCRHHHLCPSFIHTHNSCSTEFNLKALFSFAACAQFQNTLLWLIRVSPGSGVLFSQSKSRSNQFLNYEIQTRYCRSFTQTEIFCSRFLIKMVILGCTANTDVLMDLFRLNMSIKKYL